MKIIQVIPTLELAGAEVMCENLIYGLKAQGNEVILISMYNKRTSITDRLQSSGIDVRFLDKKRGLDFSIFGKLKKIFIEEKPDVVHTHLYAQQYAMPAAMLAGVKRRVHTVHSVATKEFGKIKRIFARWFYKRHNVTPVALSALVKDSILAEYGLPEEKVPVIFNGIDLSNCIEKEEYAAGDLFKILHIGRFSEEKNHKMLIEAFNEFHSLHPNTKLQLIGDGDLRDSVEHQVAEMGLGDSVEFLGLKDNVYGYLHDADLFTLPSIYEGVPMTLIEAMGTGLPIVATAVGGVPDMLKNSESALLVSVDVKSIANAFETYYLNEKMRQQHGNAAFARSEVFSSETMSLKYKTVYDKED